MRKLLNGNKRLLQYNEQHTQVVIEDAGALRSGRCDLISLLPNVDYWQTDRQEHGRTHTHSHRPSYTHTRVLSIYRHACGTESRGTALRHSLNMQQAILNKQENWMERVGARATARKKKADWLGIFLKEKVRATLCPSNRRAIRRGEKKKGSEEKRSRQLFRAALTDHCWLKDMWKDSSQNSALPSWTFYSAEKCSWYKRRSKRNMPVNNLSVFRQPRGLKHTAICVTASLNSQSLPSLHL